MYSNETVVEFTRGCASINEIGKNFGEKKPSTVNYEESCVTNSDGSGECVVVCDTNLCNNVNEIKLTEVIEETISGGSTVSNSLALLAASLITLYQSL